LSYDYERVLQLVQDRVASTARIDDLMRELVRELAQLHPHEDWSLLGDLDYDETPRVDEWWSKAMKRRSSRKGLRGLWFGLRNPVRRGKATADLYLCGSRQFSSVDEGADWAARAEWFPQGGDLKSRVLDGIYKLAYPGRRRASGQSEPLGNKAEYPLCLGYGAFLIKRLIERHDADQILRDSDRVGVAVGFDSGDFILLGEVGSGGLELEPTGGQ
jgi:hypothetical protein